MPRIKLNNMNPGGYIVLAMFFGITGSAVYFFIKKKLILSLISILLLGLVVRVSMSLDKHLHPWDERYHALVAKNMIHDPFKPVLIQDKSQELSVKDWRYNHVWLHKPPMSLWMMSLSLKIFGVHEFSARIPSILLSTCSILFVFLLGRKLLDEETALLASYLYAINGFLLDQSAGRAASDHVDTAFLFFSLVAVYFLAGRNVESKWNLLWAGIFFAFALLTKSYIAMLIPAIWFTKELLITEGGFKGKRFIVNGSFLVLPALILFLPWQLYIQWRFPVESAWESYYNFIHLFEALEDHGEPWYYYLSTIRVYFNETVYIAIFYAAYKSFRENNKNLLLLLVWFSIPFLVFSISATKMPGYLDVCAPAIFLIIAYFPIQWLKTPKFKWLKIMVVFLVLTFSIRFSIENIDLKSIGAEEEEWSKKIKKGEFIKEHEIEYLFYNS